MDINKHSSTPRPTKNAGEVLSEALLRTRSRVRAFHDSLTDTEPVRPEKRSDRVDISPHTAILNELDRGEVEPEKLLKLKRLYQSGELNDPKRFLMAAGRILGAE